MASIPIDGQAGFRPATDTGQPAMEPEDAIHDILPPDPERRRPLAAAAGPDLPDIARAFALRDAAFRLTTPQIAPPQAARRESVDIDPLPRPRRAAPPPPRMKARFRKTFALAMTLCLCAAGLLLARDHVTARYPRLAKAYALAGVPAGGTLLAIAGIGAQVMEVDGREFLVVEGDIANRSPRSAAVPPLALEVRDAAGIVVFHWEAGTGLGALEAGRTGRFRARLAAPPSNGRNVVVRFADPVKAASRPAPRNS